MNDLICAGAEFDFGTVIFNEQEIIEFARQYDPLDFHLDKEAARKHFFKDIVTSGPQVFNYFYKTFWIPKFGKTVLCGIGVDHWRFLKPIYAGDEISCHIVITDSIFHADRNSTTIRWNFNFFNQKNEICQHLEMLVLHRLND